MSRRKFIIIPVLGVYLFYALFPLLFATRIANAEDAVYINSPPSTIQQSIIEKALFLTSSGEQNSDTSSSPFEHILLKKKRALAPSFKELVPKLISQYAKFTDCEHSFTISFVLLRTSDNAQSSSNGFSYYHSGISPPSA